MQGLSVIVCCYNSESRLRRTLEHLAAQIYDGIQWEVIIVDNASQDNTAAEAKKIGQDLLPGILVVVKEPNPGLTNARMRGVSEARFEILLFCDDDNWLSKTYVQDAYRLMSSDSRIGAAGGVGKPVSNVAFPPWFDSYRGFYACYAQGDQDGELIDPLSFLFGAGMVIRKEVFEVLHIRGFKPLLADRTNKSLISGGDQELSYALRLIGYKLWYSSKLEFEHFIPSGRLTHNYLVKLVTSISWSSGFLSGYSYVLQGKQVGRMVWLKDISYQSYFFIRSFVLLMVGRRELKDRLDFRCAYARLLSLFQQAGIYYKRCIGIRRLRYDSVVEQ